MKKRKNGKARWLSVLLAGSLLLSVIPATAFATENAAATEGKETTAAEAQSSAQKEEGRTSERPDTGKTTTENASNNVDEKASEHANADNNKQADTSNETSSSEISTHVDNGYDFLPEGVTVRRLHHIYHTRFDVTANVSVKDSDGAVAETTQEKKSSGNFITGKFMTAEAQDAAVKNLRAEIEASYKVRGTVTSKSEKGQQFLVGFKGPYASYSFIPKSGNPIDFGSDLEAVKRYFREHPDAVGTFSGLTVHQYNVIDYTYDLIVQENSQPAVESITSAAVQNVDFSIQPGDAPKATAEVPDHDAGKYEIAYECWQEFEHNKPVAAWYSDNGSHGSLPAITRFEAGKEYAYFVMLKPRKGYSFSNDAAMTVNGEKAKSSLSGTFLYAPAAKTITMPTIKVIDVVEINNATVSFKDGSKPVFTGSAPDGAPYGFRCEWWELNSTTGLVSTEPEWGDGIYKNKITTFEAGKTYRYGVFVSANGDVGNVRYVFGPDTKLKINGNFVNYKQYEGYKPDFSDGTTMSMWVLTDLAMTPETSGEVTAEKYTVTYTDGVDGEEVFKDQSYTVQAGKATPAFNGTPARKGYAFAGWSPAVAGTATGNATYKAIWKPNSATTTPSDDKPNTGDTTNPKTEDASKVKKSAATAVGKSSAAAMPKTGAAGDAVLRIALLFAGVGALSGAAMILRKRKCNR